MFSDVQVVNENILYLFRMSDKEYKISIDSCKNSELLEMRLRLLCVVFIYFLVIVVHVLVRIIINEGSLPTYFLLIYIKF